jgi:esterase FrsA
MINRLMWIWRGVDPKEILDVQARIVMSDGGTYRSRTLRYGGGLSRRQLDLRMGDSGDAVAAKAGQEAGSTLSGRHWLHASNLYSIAAYPHIKGMSWQSRRRRWRIAPMKRQRSVCLVPARDGVCHSRRFAGDRLCICPKGEGFSHRPDVRRAGWLQSDYYNLYERYFAPASPC